MAQVAMLSALMAMEIRSSSRVLPGALGASAFSLWEDYSDALHASALACAQAVIARLREGIFWPPGSLAGGYQDDLAGLLLDDPAATMEPPPAPWRAAP